MRHRKKGRKLGRTASHRKAMLRNMVTTLLDLEKLETTDAKAKEVRSLAERLVSLAKRGDDLAARRQVLKVVRDKKVVAKLFNELGPRYADRPGGYTRVVKVENRRGDAAPLSVVQFVTEPVTFKEMKHKREEEEEPAAAAPPEPEVEEADRPEETEAKAEAEDSTAGEVPEEELAVEPEETEQTAEVEEEKPEAGAATEEETPVEGEEKKAE